MLVRMTDSSEKCAGLGDAMLGFQTAQRLWKEEDE